MLFLESSVHQRDCHKVWCDTKVDNVQSISLLISLGYTKVATLKNHWYGLDYYLWEKLINKQ